METVTITPFGTATNGVDFVQIADSVVFMPGQVYDTLDLQIIADGITEGVEWVSFNLTSTNNCFTSSVNTDTFYIFDAPDLSITTYGDTSTLCPGDVVTIGATATGGSNPFYTYEWSTGQTTASFSVSPNVTTTYLVRALDSCRTPSAWDSVIVTVPIRDSFVVNPEFDTIRYCAYRAIDLEALATGGTPPYTFQWQGSFPAGDSVRTEPIGDMIYTVIATDYCGRTASATAFAQLAPVVADFQIDSVNFDTWQFTNLSSQDATSLYWRFGDGDTSTTFDPLHTYKDTGTYTIRLIAGNADGCTDTTTKVLVVPKGFYLYMPNAFSPDGDNINDTWKPGGVGIKAYRLEIYSRWGEKIFESTDPNVGWDGTWKGNPAPTGNYSYYLQVEGVFNVRWKPSGIITLIR